MNSLIVSLTDGILNYLTVASLIAAVSVALMWGIIKFSGIGSPVKRYMIWLWLLVGVVVLPGVWMHGPRLTLAVLANESQPVETANETVVGVEAPVELAYGVNEGISSAESTPVAVLSGSQQELSAKAMVFGADNVLVGIWIVGVVVMFVRLVVSWVGVRRIRISSRVASDNELFSEYLKYRSRILVSDAVDGPVCFGVFRPVVVLPQAMVESSTTGQLRMILSHELAHIERGDCVVNIFQRVVESLLFFHPFVWYASGRLRQEREHICDNYVIAQGASAADYVELLSQIVSRGRGNLRYHAVALFEGTLLSRVRTMLDGGHNPETKLSGGAKVGFAVIISACAIFGVIRLKAAPAVDNQVYKEVVVNVTDSKGVGVSGASVEALAEFKPVAQGRTDKNGQAVLKVPETSQVAWIVALKDGVGFDYFENYQNLAFDSIKEIPEQVSLKLDGARRIRIRAVGTEGDLLSNVPFIPWTIIKIDKRSHVNLSGSGIARKLTDSKGIATFDWFPAETSEESKQGPRAGTSFLVQGGNYYWSDYLKKPYKQYEGVTTARLLENTSVSGRVLYPDRRPAEGILVRAEGRGNTPYFCRRSVRTGSDGTYRLSLYPDQIYMLTIDDDQWASRSKTGLIVRQAQPLGNIDFNLTEGTLIDGTVIAEDKAMPVGGQLVFLAETGVSLSNEFNNKAALGSYSSRQGLIRTTLTDEHGRYSFRTGAGDYTLGILEMIDHSGNLDAAKKFTIDSQEHIHHELRKKTRAGIGGKSVGVAFATGDEIYEGTMVFNDCSYCHAPVNASSKPKAKVVK